MYLYKKEKRFHPKTGKEIPDFVKAGYICDYSGVFIESSPEFIEYDVEIGQISGCEETWYYDDDVREFFEEKYGIDHAYLWTSPFHFAQTDNIYDHSWSLMNEWVQDCQKKKSPFYMCGNIDKAMRIARVRTIKKLLDVGIYTIEELLGGELE